MKNALKTALLGSALLAAPVAMAEIRNAELLDQNETIVENAMKVSNFTTLVTAVEAAGLVEPLMGEGPYTIFAPTNEAFAKLPEGTIEELLMPDNQAILAGILKAHVVPGIYTSEDLAGLDIAGGEVSESYVVDPEAGSVTFKTLDINDIVIDRDGSSFYVNAALGTDENARIIEGDIMASNGIIHVIDEVLTPGM